MPEPSSIELCQQLVEASEYLMREDVYYLLTIANIGITEAGEVKIYISPLEIVDERNKNLTKADVMASIDKIIGWWNNTLARREAENSNAQTHGKMSSSLGFPTPNVFHPNAKIISSFIEKSHKEDEEEEMNDEVNNETSFPQKMRNIEKEINTIKEKMMEKIKNR